MMRILALWVLLCGLLPLAGCRQAADGAPPLPTWATSFHSPRDLQDFQQQVTTYFQDQGIAVTLHDGWVVPTTELREAQFSLIAIARRCARLDQDVWPQIIAAHFDQARKELAQRDRYAQQARDFTWARDRLVLRLYDQMTFDADPSDLRLVYRVDLPGTYTVLSLDLPQTSINVDRKMLAAWGANHDELFDLALGNVARMPQLAAEWTSLSAQTRVFILKGNPYASAMALKLKQFPNAIGRFGSIVAAPVRDQLVVLPINDAAVALNMHDMLVLAWGMSQEGPGTVTGRLYWYRDGTYRQLPYAATDSGIDFSPPDDFIQLLRDLSAARQTEQQTGPGTE